MKDLKKNNFYFFFHFYCSYFQDVLASSNLPLDTNEIQLHSDGSWSTHVVVKKESKVKTSNELDESVQIIDDGKLNYNN